MHTVDLLEEALGLAGELGYRVRQEWLDGGGGGCEIKGQKWLFLDLALDPLEQLEQVVETLRLEPTAPNLTMSAQLTSRLRPRKSA